MNAYLKKQIMILLMAWGLAGLIWPTAGKAEALIYAPAPLAQLIDEGIDNNRAIKALETQIKASKFMEPVAGALQDPRLGISVLNLPVNTFQFDQEPMTQKQISIAQEFPWFGKRALRSERASLLTQQKQMMLLAEKLTLAKDIAADWYDLGFIDKSLEVNHRLIQMVDRIHRSAVSRYETGYGLQQDIFQAQVELSRLKDEKITLTKKRRVMEDRINELLNRTTFQPIPPGMVISYPEPALSVPDLIKTADTHNPELAARKIEITRGGTDINLAKKDFLPDFDIKLAYGQRDNSSGGQPRDDFISAGVTMNLPVWQNSRQDKKLAAAMSSKLAAEHAFQDFKSRLAHRIDALVTEIRETGRNLRLYEKTLIPQAEQWARSATDAYEVNKMEFDTMINAHIRLLGFTLEEKRYLFDLFKKQAELEVLIGQPLN